MHLAKRCCANSKRSGIRCKAPAVRGKRVCRMHGANAGAPCGSKHGRFIHGAYAKDFLGILKLGRERHRIILEALK